MKKWSGTIISSNENKVKEIISSELKGFTRISSKYSELFLADINKLRIDSSMSLAILLETEDFQKYNLHIISGGGKMDNLIPIGLNAEVSELHRFKKLLADALNKEGYKIFDSNEDYYGFP